MVMLTGSCQLKVHMLVNERKVSMTNRPKQPNRLGRVSLLTRLSMPLSLFYRSYHTECRKAGPLSTRMLLPRRLLLQLLLLLLVVSYQITHSAASYQVTWKSTNVNRRLEGVK